jgi:RluA family pseudouridine synthase
MILRAMVGEAETGMRLDDGAKSLFPQLSKGEIRRIIDWGGCSVGDKMVRVASRPLRFGEDICLGVMESERYVELRYGPSNILMEDNEYLAVNKDAGINSQRTPYQLKGTVEHAVSVYFKEHGISEPARVIHRLDRGTSGVIFFPKHKQSATHLGYLVKQGGVEKVYWTVVDGEPEEESWRIDAPIAKLNKFRYGVALPGKEAATEFRVLSRGKGVALLEARPLTGRTHQIRVHLVHSGLPVLGDTVYGGGQALRMMLHCRNMAFRARDGRTISATAPLDKDFTRVCLDAGIPIPHGEIG